MTSPSSSLTLRNHCRIASYVTVIPRSEDVFDISEAQAETVVEPDDVTDDF